MSYYTSLHKPILPIMTPDEVAEFGARYAGRLITTAAKKEAAMRAPELVAQIAQHCAEQGVSVEDYEQAQRMQRTIREIEYIQRQCATYNITRDEYDMRLARLDQMYLAGNYARVYIGEDGMDGSGFTAIDDATFAEGKEYCGWEFNDGFIDYKVKCIVFLPGNESSWMDELYANVPEDYFIDVPFRAFSSDQMEDAVVDEGVRLFRVLFYRDYEFNYSVGQANAEQVFATCEELQAFLRRLSAESHSREDRNEDFSWLCTLWSEPFVAYTF